LAGVLAPPESPVNDGTSAGSEGWHILVLTISDLLMDGETFIGDYNMEIARWKDGLWSAMIPPLYAIVTDRRLILQPHSRKHHDPAIIPASYIERIQDFSYQYRNGIILHLTTGQKIAVFIPNLRREEIRRNLHTITAGTTKSKEHTMTLDLGGLQKFIDYVSGL
jgi:hypothetical protein